MKNFSMYIINTFANFLRQPSAFDLIVQVAQSAKIIPTSDGELKLGLGFGAWNFNSAPLGLTKAITRAL